MKFINFILFLTFAIGLIIFLFWYLGIFKKEAELGKEFLEIKSKIQFINNYPFEGLNQYLQKLPTTRIEIPQISPGEIGKPSLF